MFGHYDHLVSCIPWQGTLFSQMCLKQLRLFDPSHPVECRALYEALSLLLFIVDVG
jgi:hypothetical protein